MSERRSNQERRSKDGIRDAGPLAAGLVILARRAAASRREATSLRSGASPPPSPRKWWQVTHPSRMNTALPRLAQPQRQSTEQAIKHRTGSERFRMAGKCIIVRARRQGVPSPGRPAAVPRT